MASVLLIDDDTTLLDGLADGLKAELGDTATVEKWLPKTGDGDPREAFEARVNADTVLVVTDYDLTKKGYTGFFGSSVVAWCQERCIAVGDYSRRVGALPKEPSLFEFRVPTQREEAVAFAAAVFRGFVAIREAVQGNAELLAKRSPAAVLAGVLGPPSQENDFAPYLVRLAATSGTLMDQVSRTAPKDLEPEQAEVVKVLVYVVGHLLLNVVLRFPGPIISNRALKAYLATSDAGADDVRALVASAAYAGPFRELDGGFHWLRGVEEAVETLTDALGEKETVETIGELRRKALELKLGRVLGRHDCVRCAGKNGGFYCPFTHATVCQLPDCSVGSSGWVPQGAKLCRVERGFFDEWAPVLGL